MRGMEYAWSFLLGLFLVLTSKIPSLLRLVLQTSQC